MKPVPTLLLALCCCLALQESYEAFAGTRVKEVARMRGQANLQFVGYGLVVGLDGTGDGRNAFFTAQAISNMLVNFGLHLPAEAVRAKNIASVMVTAETSPHVKNGQRLDVVVSSMGDAKSLEGGVLLMTLLQGPDGENYGRAQGPVSIGGFNIRTVGGDQVRRNYALVGRVPGGMVVEKEPPVALVNADSASSGSLSLILNEPDYTTATRLAEAINQKVGNETASPIDAGEVRLLLPQKYQGSGGLTQFISTVESLEFEPDVRPRVVVNERTGTVVVGQGVTISPAAIAHGNLSVEINVTPIVSQPLPFSEGRTTVVPEAQTEVKSDAANLMFISDATTVQNVANALNALGVTPRDLIAIFQALAAAGALKAELIIM